MILYVDSSALLKRVFDEEESDHLESALEEAVRAGDSLVASALAWIEVERATRTASLQDPEIDAAQLAEDALAGVGDSPIGSDVVSLARRIGPLQLRSLDAIHLASAILLDVDVLYAYDDRLTDAARHHGVGVAAPGRELPRS